MKRFFLVLLILVFVGCDEEKKTTLGTSEVNNPHYQGKVENLFTDEAGYTVHRFEDNGNTVYYVTPGPNSVSQHWTTKNDDTTVHHQRTTVTK